MPIGMQFSRWIVLVLALISLGGCATTGANHPSDPIESFNRGTDEFNRFVDRVAMKPVAKGYRVVTPDPLDKGVTNFFNNLADINSAVNNLLQFKPDRALTDVGRICINSTIGLFGLFDVASDLGLQSYKEDFGQTLGYWGVGETPYFVIPFLGPSTLRDFAGILVDVYMNPFYYTSEGVYWSLIALNVIDTRADLLETTDVLEEAALDPYVFTRESYLQIRRREINDGQSPEQDAFGLDDEIMFDDDPPPPNP